MKDKSLLNLGGIILGTILSLPSFLALFLTPYQGIAIVVLIFGIGILIISCYWRYLQNLPFWTIRKYERTLTIKKKDGSEATLGKKMLLGANHKGLSEYLHKGIRADGKIQNFTLNGQSVPENDIKRRAGEYIITEHFRPLKKGRVIKSLLTYDLVASFPNNHEYSGIERGGVEFPVKEAILKVCFPPKRLPKNAKICICYRGETEEIKLNSTSTNGDEITWEGKNLKTGRSYIIEWDW